MRIAVLAETDKAEPRVAATPETVKKFASLGADVAVQAGAGAGAGVSDADYAAAGAAVLASDGPVYRGSVADGPGGMLVSNNPEAWYAALSRLIRDRTLRRSLQQGAWDAYLARGTLGTNLAAWDFLLAP